MGRGHPVRGLGLRGRGPRRVVRPAREQHGQADGGHRLRVVHRLAPGLRGPVGVLIRLARRGDHLRGGRAPAARVPHRAAGGRARALLGGRDLRVDHAPAAAHHAVRDARGRRMHRLPREQAPARPRADHRQRRGGGGPAPGDLRARLHRPHAAAALGRHRCAAIGARHRAGADRHAEREPHRPARRLRRPGDRGHHHHRSCRVRPRSLHRARGTRAGAARTRRGAHRPARPPGRDPRPRGAA